MLKRVLIAMIMAALATTGVLFPELIVEKAVSFLVGEALASPSLSSANGKLSFAPPQGAVSESLSVATVEALRPSYPHFRGYRPMIPCWVETQPVFIAGTLDLGNPR